MKGFSAHFKQFLSNRIIILVLIMSLFLAVQAIAQSVRSHVKLEAESGSLSGNAMTHSAADASNGSYVTFGMGGSSQECAVGPQLAHNSCLNQATIPAAVSGFSTARTTSVSYAPNPVCFNNEQSGCNDNAAFRTECSLSHTSKDDPIVYPGQAGAAHWHQFFGNTAANAHLTDARTQGNSTCNGGILNRTAYWAPALINTNSYNAQTRTFDLAQVMTDTDPQNPGAGGRGGTAMQAYYKLGYYGARIENIEWFPAGLRMIAGGNPNVAPTGPIRVSAPFDPQFRPVYFDCISWGHAQSTWGTRGVDWDTDRIPANCPAGYYIQATIVFPQCGAVDGQGNPVLDSPDHRSHMSYPSGWPDRGCPSSHPRTYPQLTEHFRWRVPAGGAAGLKFSADMFANAQPGWTFHADWWNGWDTNTAQTLINNCFRNGPYGHGFDCSMNLLGTRHPSGGWTALQ